MATYDRTKRINPALTDKMKFYAKLADWLVKANAPEFIAFSKVSDFSKASLNRVTARAKRKRTGEKKNNDEIWLWPADHPNAMSLHAVNRKRINFNARSRVQIESTKAASRVVRLVKTWCFSIWIYFIVFALNIASISFDRLVRASLASARSLSRERFTIIIRKPINRYFIMRQWMI